MHNDLLNEFTKAAILYATVHFVSNRTQAFIQQENVWHFLKHSVYDICRPQTADRRLQIADCKLNDTKNLPNKGDVFKNIKSCESEKVALGTRLIFLCKVTLASFPKCCCLFFTDPLSTHPAYH